MRLCCVCKEAICLPDYLVVARSYDNVFICKDCKERVAAALLDEDRVYYEGVRRDRRRGRRTKPRKVLL